MSSRKSRPGVCDICGQAVMRSPYPPEPNWIRNGHVYKKGKLVQVRCIVHGGLRFEPFPGACLRIDCFTGCEAWDAPP